MSIKVHIERDWATGAYRVYVLRRERDGRVAWAARNVEMVMEEIACARPGGTVIDKIPPFLEIDPLMFGEDLLAGLAVELARLGFRAGAQDEEQMKGALKAKEDHLQDMRKLVFDQKKG